MRFLVASATDLSHKNFASLRRFLDDFPAVEAEFDDGSTEFKGIGPRFSLSRELPEFGAISRDSSGRYRGIEPFPLFREELLRALALRKSFRQARDDEYAPLSNEELISIAERHFSRTLERLNNVTIHLVEHAARVLEVREPDVVLAFSRTSIFSRAMEEVSRFAGIPFFALESVATGDSTVLRSSNRASRLQALEEREQETLKDAEEAVIQRFVLPALNKNVTILNPVEETALLEESLGRFRLLVTQVPIDATMTEGTPFTYSIKVYADVIRRLVLHDGELVVKLHPWERVKLGFNWTHRELVKMLEPEVYSRVRFVEGASTEALVNRAEAVYAISSQVLATAILREVETWALRTEGGHLQLDPLYLPRSTEGSPSDVARAFLKRRNEVLVPQQADWSEAWAAVFGFSPRKPHFSVTQLHNGWASKKYFRKGPRRAIRALRAGLRAANSVWKQ